MVESWPPAGAELLVSFHVQGKPVPAGSKNAVPLMRYDKDLGRRVPILRDGVPIVNQMDSSGTRGTNWRADIRQCVADALEVAHELADGPLAVRTTFFISSPAARYGTGRNAGVLKPNAARYPHKSKLADGDKLSRALHDALTSVVWRDDSRVCECWWSRAYGDDGARVDVFTLPEFVSEAAIEQSGTLLLLPDQSVILPDDADRDETEAFAAIAGR